MTPNETEHLASLIRSVSSALNEQEKLAIPSLNIKLQRAVDLHPHDQTIRAVANILSKMEANKKLLITRAELKSLYDNSYSNHTKFAECFREELGLPSEKETVKTAANKQDQAFDPNFQKAFSDPILSNALDSVFNSQIPLKLFSKEMAEKAKRVVSDNLEAWNFKSSKLEVESGNEHFIVVKADYETPKGLTSILVPVEVSNGKVAIPNLFMGNRGPQDLNYVSLKAYVSSQAGNKLNIRASDMLAALSSSITKTAGLSSVELALTKMNASRENSLPFFADSVIGLKQNPVVKNAEVELPKSGQFASFAEKFDSPLGYANLHFGVDKVNLGRDVVLRTLASLGVKNSQVNITDANENTIVYAVSLNDGRVAFNVPVKYHSNRLITPDLLICNGTTFPFSKTGLQQLLKNGGRDYRAAAITSAQYGLKPNELIDNVRQSMINGNYSKAEDSLNILLAEENIDAYKIAFTIYSNGLSVSNNIIKDQSGCSMIVKNSSSEYDLCGHTGLPTHKIYQDKYGNCHPLYRRNMEENYEPTSFMNSKIFG
jgi:hypothetical protein